MERFIIGHNADPSNWQKRLELLTPRCLEIFIPPRYSDGEGLQELFRAFEEMARHPVARDLEFLSCHFPWGEGGNGYSQYNLVDHQYFFSFMEIAKSFDSLCRELGISPERCALNFHNLYEVPRVLLEEWKREDRLSEARDIFIAHAREQTRAAKQILDLLRTPITLVNENNPPIGDGNRMSVVDVAAHDLHERAVELQTRTCMDLSHFFMTRFYLNLPPDQRPPFPYLEHVFKTGSDGATRFTFENYMEELKPLYFHVSDTKVPGTSRDCEGVPIGSGDTPWGEVLPAMARYASGESDRLFMIVEIKGGHTSEGTELCATSEKELRNVLRDCFTSGFLGAISNQESEP